VPATLRFRSVLFPSSDQPGTCAARQSPACFGDLNLDRIVEAVTADWKDYELASFFHAPLDDLDAIAYRQEIMRDLEKPQVMQAVLSFSERMRAMRQRLLRANQHYYACHKERLFLAATEIYCQAVGEFERALRGAVLRSRGLLKRRVKVYFVTHLYIFAHYFFETHKDTALLLRAERRHEGSRTFKLHEGEPSETSHGEDVYLKIFGAPVPEPEPHRNADRRSPAPRAAEPRR
jgi:hypothetical protein